MTALNRAEQHYYTGFLTASNYCHYCLYTQNNNNSLYYYFYMFL